MLLDNAGLCLKSRRKAGFFSLHLSRDLSWCFLLDIYFMSSSLGNWASYSQEEWKNLHKDPRVPLIPARQKSCLASLSPTPAEVAVVREGSVEEEVLFRALSREEAPEEASRPCHNVPLSQQTLFIRHKFKNKIIRNSLKPLLSLEPRVGCMPIEFWFQRSAVLMFLKKQWILDP